MSRDWDKSGAYNEKIGQFEHRSQGNSNNIVHSRPRKLKVKCSMCGRQMEISRSNGENGPWYCWKCSDKSGIPESR
jgi:ribosomal protein L37AE/L43A